MNVYAESSAILSWLLGEAEGEEARGHLASAEIVLTSALTLVECDRSIIRAASTGRISEAEASDLRAALARTADHWTILLLDDATLSRARRPFPREPLRTLDAIHLAAALEARTLVDEMCLLSLDVRIREAGRELGLAVVPD